ncbi:MAG: hypothetical protein Q4C42_08450 [Clostridia bacterium]|nr:hypothetical protein [Clostridia bacterium]
MNIFPVPLTVMVSALMGIYALLGVWCSLGGLFGKKLKNTYRVLIWMIGFAQLFVIFSCLIIGYGFYFRLCDLLILTFTLLMPLLYNVFLIRAINSRGK